MADVLLLLGLKSLPLSSPQPARPQIPKDSGIVLEGVVFKYSLRSRIIVDIPFLHVPEGKLTALVGRSGEGKTTLLGLLTQLYRPNAGTITIDGVELQAAAIPQLCITCDQEALLFNTSVRENILIGTKPGEVSNPKPSITPFFQRMSTWCVSMSR